MKLSFSLKTKEAKLEADVERLVEKGMDQKAKNDHWYIYFWWGYGNCFNYRNISQQWYFIRTSLSHYEEGFFNCADFDFTHSQKEISIATI